MVSVDPAVPAAPVDDQEIQQHPCTERGFTRPFRRLDVGRTESSKPLDRVPTQQRPDDELFPRLQDERLAVDRLRVLVDVLGAVFVIR